MPGGVSQVPDGLVAYLAAREQQRVATVARVFAQLSDREKRLVREAAVMGYVRGRQIAPLNREPIPPDSQILFGVVDACSAMGDLYPTFAALADGEELS